MVKQKERQEDEAQLLEIDDTPNLAAKALYKFEDELAKVDAMANMGYTVLLKSLPKDALLEYIIKHCLNKLQVILPYSHYDKAHILIDGYIKRYNVMNKDTILKLSLGVLYALPDDGTSNFKDAAQLIKVIELVLDDNLIESGMVVLGRRSRQQFCLHSLI